MAKNRTADYYRAQRRRAIERKKRIIHGQNDYWHFSHDGVLSKGKIHCSCPMCRRKSYDQASFSDQRKAAAAISELEEYGDAGAREAEHVFRATQSDQRRGIKGTRRSV